MGKRKISKSEIIRLINEHGGNVHAIAAAKECSIQTIYNTIDAYDLRSALDHARDSVSVQAAKVIKNASPEVLAALVMLIDSTGAITRNNLVEIGVDLPESNDARMQPTTINGDIQ